MRSQPDSATLDGLLDGSVRRLIEQRFWEPIEANAEPHEISDLLRVGSS